MLICPRCGREYPEDYLRCPECDEPLQFPVFSGTPRGGSRTWIRFGDFYPFPLNTRHSLGEGDTPLLHLLRLSEKLGVRIYAKNETMNPTWSFKDRGTFLAIQHALRASHPTVGTVSTGNMGASVAAYASHAGVKAYILVSSNIPEDKLTPIAVYGARIIRVLGDYGELYYRSIEIGEKKGIYFINSDNPFRVEGYKSIAFEIAESVSADYVIIPTSSGGLFRGIHKGFRELEESGIAESPTLVCAQASGCAPIFTAFSRGREKVEHFENPSTVAHAIANPYPPSGNQVLGILRKGHLCTAVTDKDIMDALRELASEGLFVQPASAVSLAALKNLVERGEIERGSSVVLILTGAGLKVPHMKLIPRVKDCKIEELSECIMKDFIG